MMSQYSIKPVTCPVCHKVLNAAACPADQQHRPEPGDVTVCFNCATICLFDESLSLTLASQEDLDQIDDEVMQEVGSIVNYLQEKNEAQWN